MNDKVRAVRGSGQKSGHHQVVSAVRLVAHKNSCANLQRDLGGLSKKLAPPPAGGHLLKSTCQSLEDSVVLASIGPDVLCDGYSRPYVNVSRRICRLGDPSEKRTRWYD